MIAFHCKSFYYIYIDWQFYLTTFFGSLSLLYLLFNALSTDFWFICLGTINSVAPTVGLAFSLIFFLRLKQINAILCKSKFSRRDLYRFTHFHSQTLVHILYADRYFGSLLLVYTICVIPLSALALMGLIRGRFNLFASSYFGIFLIFLYNGLVTFPIIGTIYVSYLHKCRYRLLHWQVNIFGKHCFNTRDRLHLDCYIQKINVKKRYGITFPIVCLITLESFIKFMMFYAKVLMFSYRLF